MDAVDVTDVINDNAPSVQKSQGGRMAVIVIIDAVDVTDVINNNAPSVQKFLILYIKNFVFVVYRQKRK